MKTKRDQMPTIDMEETGKNIKRLVSESGLSVEELRKKLGFTTRAAIYRWYRGETIPSTDNQICLKEILGLDCLDQLLVLAEGEETLTKQQ